MDFFNYLAAIVSHWKLILAVLAGTLVTYLLFRLILAILNRRHLAMRDMTWLEITPPTNITKTPEATEQLFSVVYGMRTARSLREQILGRTPTMSFEIVSSRKDGIRYLLQIEKHRSDSMQKMITSYIPDSKVREIEHETLPPDRVIEFAETGHYVLPLTLANAFDQHDPLAYITGAMTKLNDNEQISMQLIIQPIYLKEAVGFSHKILGNENILSEARNKRFSTFGKLNDILYKITAGMMDMTSEAVISTAYGYKSYYDNKSKQLRQETQAFNRERPRRTLSAFETQLMETMHRKVTQALFQVNLRVLITSPNAKEHATTIRSALDGFSVPPYQSLKAKTKLPVVSSIRTKNAQQRLPSLTQKQAIILSASELAGLYHFPSSRISRTDNLITSLSRTLPAPVSLKNGRKLAIILGNNEHHGTTTPIGLSESERERHVYIIGGTGNGKTTMLQYAIVQDIQNGKGVAVIDPHGDLAETLLRHIPKDRIKDVIYMNPDDLTHPIGVNLLELPAGLTGDDLLREKDIITESTISVLRKVFSEDDSGGHRIEYVLRNTIQTALSVENPTLFTIFELLNNNKYRRDVVNSLEDENLKNFWKNELGKAGDFQKVKMVAGITAKIGRFLFSGSAKRVLEQEKSTIDFDDILDSGKILICNFSKGLLGEDTSALFGTTILAKLQLASLRRARKDAVTRRPFYLYVDEFQNFATMSFVQMLSEARKYKLFLTMAEQSTSQQDEQRLVQIILANVGTVICFRSGSPADERLVLPLFTPLIEQGEIANLPSYSYYVRIAAIQSQEPMSGVTVLLKDEGYTEIADRVRQSSRQLYAITVDEETTQQPKKVESVKDTLSDKPKPRRRKTTATRRNSGSAKQAHKAIPKT